jgi:hypothetical protein
MVVTDDLPMRAEKADRSGSRQAAPMSVPWGVAEGSGRVGAARPAKESAIRRAFIGTLVKRVQERVRNDDKKPHKSFV